SSASRPQVSSSPSSRRVKPTKNWLATKSPKAERTPIQYPPETRFTSKTRTRSQCGRSSDRVDKAPTRLVAGSLLCDFNRLEQAARFVERFLILLSWYAIRHDPCPGLDIRGAVLNHERP